MNKLTQIKQSLLAGLPLGAVRSQTTAIGSTEKQPTTNSSAFLKQSVGDKVRSELLYEELVLPSQSMLLGSNSGGPDTMTKQSSLRTSSKEFRVAANVGVGDSGSVSMHLAAESALLRID